MAYLGVVCVLLVAVWAEGTLAKYTVEDRVNNLEFLLKRLERKLDMMERDQYKRSTQRIGDCPDGFDREFDGYCYYFNDEAVSWDTAKEECQEAKGAYIVEITTSKENHFLRVETGTVGGSRWIGLHDPTGTSKWTWYASQAVIHPGDFEDWAQGEPNNLGTEKCAQINHQEDYHWNNAKCSYKYPYICKVKKGIK